MKKQLFNRRDAETQRRRGAEIVFNASMLRSDFQNGVSD